VLSAGTAPTWRLFSPRAQIRLGDPLRAQACGERTLPAAEAGLDEDTLLIQEREPTVSLYRDGAGTDVARGGELVAIRVRGVGFLSASPPVPAQRGSQVVIVQEPVAEWIVTGVAPGVELPVNRPVGMFNITCGEYLVGDVCPSGIRLGWAARRCPGPEAELPIPETWRPAEGSPQIAEFTGMQIPVHVGFPSSGFLVLVDRQEAADLGRLLHEQRPELAEALAPERTVGVIACRKPQPEPRTTGEYPDPEPGSRVWGQGRLVADSGACADPVRVLAWAETERGEAVIAAPTGPEWPDTVMTWWVRVFRTAPDRELRHGSEGRPTPGEEPAAVYLALPSRDGERGSTTTVTPVTPSERAAVPPALPRGTPGLFRDSRTGRRVLRLALPETSMTVTRGWTVRVHLPR
jgi:hypothetical protein